MQLNLQFHASDLDTVPEQGVHEVVIDSARVRTSKRGNPTIQVIYRTQRQRDFPDILALSGALITTFVAWLLPGLALWLILAILPSSISAIIAKSII